MRCEFGYCLICDKEIAPSCGECGRRKPNSDYTEVRVNLSNGSGMSIAVCVDCCKEKVWTADKNEMMRAVQEAWNKQPGGSHDPALRIVA